MNKVNQLVFLFCLSQLTYGQAYKGIYLGTAAGLVNRTASVQYVQSYTSNNPGDPGVNEFIDNSERNNNTNPVFNLYGGYGYLFGAIYAGLEGAIGADLSHTQTSNTVPGTDGASYLVRTTYERDFFYRLSLRLGVLFSDDTLFTFNPSFEFSRYRFQHFAPGVTTFGVTYTPSPLFPYDKRIISFVPSIAFEKFYHNVIFRIEYAHDFGSKVTRVFNYTGFGVTPAITYLYQLTDLKHIRLSGNIVKIGVAYNFS